MAEPVRLPVKLALPVDGGTTKIAKLRVAHTQRDASAELLHERAATPPGSVLRFMLHVGDRWCRRFAPQPPANGCEPCRVQKTFSL
jgi:hypothetical protein